ncbi:class I SAM-dependent methyltransferase [Paracoccus sp. Z330]|uniref:Class I SAM-dependent methyltransferase n=1 Tax=Paracoccus onchidii TaxID=3017813 RepID=A0ABT4ZGD6_9RHOB|nr:class I SAM-dependent methyltransferase [Paracoccus onchidii]MDB6177781.1 class I SAM-dependent methyltransferase [Paracoccus onchidii]
MSAQAKHIVGLYRRHAQAWADLRGTVLLERVWLEHFENRMPPPRSVLDIGCGSGDPIGRYLVNQGCAVTGIDSSPELIQIAQRNIPGACWTVSDMRGLELDAKFSGILAWNSMFHLTPDEQRRMFPVFERHACPAAVLMFTSGAYHGCAIGEFQGEALYHASLASDEYHLLLSRHGFEVIERFVQDDHSGQHVIWLARFLASATDRPASNRPPADHPI